MKATEKHPALDLLLGGLTRKSRTVTISKGECMTCDSQGNNARSFTDDLSRKEYQISGMCQKCQDDFFGISEDDA